MPLSKVLKLNNGSVIPTVGLGTYNRFIKDEVKNAVKWAVEAGYRHIDTAWFYQSEGEIGKALIELIQEGKVRREDVFITTKLWSSFHEKKDVVPKLEESLKNLQMDYVDLYLIHGPIGFKEGADLYPQDLASLSDVDYLETWEGMEDCVKLGLTRSIGLSNFSADQVDRVLKNCNIKPAVNQIEFNPNHREMDLIRFCQEKDIVVTGYTPLERIVTNIPNSDYKADATILDPKVVEIAKKYNKTPAQVVLRYLLSFGISIVPKSVTQERIIENIQIFDFDLTPEDTKYLDSRNKNIRCVPFTGWKGHKYYPFKDV